MLWKIIFVFYLLNQCDDCMIKQESVILQTILLIYSYMSFVAIHFSTFHSVQRLIGKSHLSWNKGMNWQNTLYWTLHQNSYFFDRAGKLICTYLSENKRIFHEFANNSTCHMYYSPYRGEGRGGYLVSWKFDKGLVGTEMCTNYVLFKPLSLEMI